MTIASSAYTYQLLSADYMQIHSSTRFIQGDIKMAPCKLHIYLLELDSFLCRVVMSLPVCFLLGELQGQRLKKSLRL